MAGISFKDVGTIIRCLTAAVLLVVAGCSEPPDRDLKDPGRILRVGTPMKIKQLNPLADYTCNILAMLLTHDTLIRLDESLRPIPQLARAWDANKDATVWTFDLVPNALWHDGEKVTSTDVKFTFDYLGKQDPAYAWIPSLIKEIKATPGRVVFALNRPCSRFLTNAGFIVRVLPQHIWKDITAPRAGETKEMMVGCGPYLFSQYDRTAGRMIFQRNPSYHGGAMGVETIEFYLNRNLDIITLSLKKGTIDLYYKYASGFPFPYLRGLTGAKNLKFITAPSMGISAVLGFNMEKAPMDDRKFRRALSLAINYRGINESLFMGKGTLPGAGFVPEAFPLQGKQPLLGQDLTRCRKILDDMNITDSNGDGIREGFDGRPLNLVLLVRCDLEGHDVVTRRLVNDFKAVGIGITVKSVDLSSWISAVREKGADLILFRTTPWGMVMDAGHGSGYFDSRRQGGGVIANVRDTVFHQLCDEILSTTDPDSLKELYGKMGAFYARTLPAIALGWHPVIYPCQGSCPAPPVNQIEGGILNRASLKKWGEAGISQPGGPLK